MRQLRGSLEYGKSMARDCNATLRPQVREWVKPILMGSSPIKSVLRSIIVLLTLLNLGTTFALADDYSGTYFIKSESPNKNTAGDYYLCPTRSWYLYKATNSYGDDTDEYDDNDMPFLTTYQCKAGGYDESKAVWTIIKHPSEADCYYIIQSRTGRYLVSNGKIGTDANRMRVHLERVADAAALATLDDLALFELTSHNGHIDIVPHSDAGRNGDSFMYLVVNFKNFNELNGSAGKTGGPSGTYGANTAGVIGLYNQEDNHKWSLEPTIIPPTLSVNATGQVVMSFADGTAIPDGRKKIYYTTDGTTTPTSSATEYTGTPITVTDAMGSAIKAITVQGGQVSNVVELPLVNYTYHMVNVNNGLSISASKKQAVGTAISGTASIPSSIVSPYLTGETITFYSFDGAFSAGELSDENIINETTTEDDIYVKYTTEHLMDEGKFLRLSGARPFNIKVGENYLYNNSGAIGNTTTDLSTSSRMWYFSGNDPYNIKVKNASGENYLTYSTSATPSTPGLASSASETFVLLGETTDGEGKQLSLKSNASGGGTLTASAFAVEVSNSYVLIDKAGKLIEDDIPSTGSSLVLPAEWQSPLVSTYHYWNTASVTDGTYTCSNEIFDIAQATPGGKIYVTYEVNNLIDLEGEKDGSKAYLLRFLDGDTFQQEDGKDGLMKDNSDNPILQKAVYPYNNGDFNLYVYGQEQWETQLSSGASTRTRWLWHFVSRKNGTNLTGDAIDPYHVVIKSHQNQSLKIGSTSYPGSTYLRTYKPNNDVGIVTGTTYENKTYPNSKPNLEELPPTEYMILGTSTSNMKLQAKVDGDWVVVNSFQQYWKNYETISKKGTYSYETITNPEFSSITLNRYQAWANARPMDTTDPTIEKAKELANDYHWYQKIAMSDGSFEALETSLAPQVILLDQHGWEIMRKPLPLNSDDASKTENKLNALRLYDSPMVAEYHWYPTAIKVSGYHKYDISDPAPEITVYENSANPANNNKVEWHATDESFEYTSTSLADSPYDHFVEKGYTVQDDKVKTDFYVTYTVKSEYADLYNGTSARSVVLKQGGKYAKATSNTTVVSSDESVNLENVPDNLQWKLKPNLDIDTEMGYTGDAISYEKEQQGFDPYNVQIQSKLYPQRYFKTDTEAHTLSAGVWTGTSSSVTLNNQTANLKSAAGYDQTTLNITNATFMVVSDTNGNMRLMPRFDHSKVLTSITTLAAQTSAAPEGDKGAGTQSVTYDQAAKLVHSQAEITDLESYYVLAEDFDFSGFTSLGEDADHPFTGTLDGKLNTLTGLTVPLVAYANNAVIKNVIIDLGTTTITGGDDAGVICSTANGATRVYNCGVLGGSISGGTNVGGIVGKLDGTSRVINCYSYANVTGGTNRAGIVGYNSYASKYNDLKTMVMNCMFYGDITTGGTISPIYGGLEISNDYTTNNSNRLNNYNYYLYEAPFSKNNTTSNVIISKYNCALAAEERFLVRFEFYRHLLNSNRELAAWYATGDASNGRGVGDENKMAKWVLDKTIAPYPILKVQDTYPSVVNYDPDNTYIKNEVTGKVESVSRSTISERNKGKNLGTLSVSISQGAGAPSGASISRSSITLQRTDKDVDNFNFNYDKVQLPYYNEVGTGNYTYNKVVTGWKIVSMVGGTAGGYSETNYDAPNYNYADRDHYGKDIYGTGGSNRVYPQGGYFNVPAGVTGITIEPYWGKAAYLSDACYDRYGYNTTDNLTEIGGGQRYTTGNTYSINGSDQKVYTSVSSALGALTDITNPTVYDYAVVLVGNYHHHVTEGKTGPELSNGDKPFTIMSIDLNKDNEPDYCLIYRSGQHSPFSPIRFDFITVPGMAMAHKMAQTSKASKDRDLGIPGNCCPKGWFEITTTGLIKYGQFEHSYKSKTNAPVIFMGGVIDQFVANNTAGKNGNDIQQNNRTQYMLFGDNVWFQMFSNGTHMDNVSPTPHRPISITGGEFESFYLSGYFRPDANPCTTDDGGRNAECYIDGGKFGEVAGAGQNKIDGNVTWLIDHADMESFYGGGINKEKAITGNISTTIKNSHVGVFCGGPKFGDMAAEKIVTTTATDCVFGTYFGAGYGGTSIYRECPSSYNQYQVKNYDFNSWVNGSYDNTGKDPYRGKYTSGKGVSCGYEYELFAGSAGNVGRLYLKYASFSLAQTNNVTSSLTGCEVTGNFYGGGSLGKVTGDVTSTLNNCTVHGSAFGAGYSASIPSASIMNTGGFKVNGVATNPNYNETTGIYEKADLPASEDFTWTQVANLSNKAQAIDGTTVKTTENLTGLGTVAGHVTLNITGNTKVEGKIFDGNGAVTAQTGGVFGGGAKSEVTGTDKTVTVNINQTGGSADRFINNVYGGGDEGDVASEVVVNVQNVSYVAHDVFGGGNAADVKKNTQVNMTAGTVMGNIYGGGNLGDVGTINKDNIRAYAWTGTDGNANSTTNSYVATNTGVTHVTISGGTPNQNVFGGGKGAATSFWCEKGMVYATDVNISNVTVGGSVFGGGELGRVETDTKVMIGPASGTDATEIKHNVFGAGQGVVTHGYSALVRGNTDVTIRNGAKVDENVYGGGEIASVGKYNVDGKGMPYSLANNGSGICRVNIPGATQITGDIFGGGKGVVPAFVESGENRSKRMVNYSATTHTEGNKGTTWNYYDDEDHTYVWEYFADNAAYLVYLQTLALATETEVTIDAGNPDSPVQSTKGNVFGGSENGIVQHNTLVTVQGKCIIGAGEGKGNIYGGGQGLEGNDGAGQVNGDATVNINSGTMNGSVFGGGVLGATKGNVTVNINGGTVSHDVYGGGAYAHTNTSNWHLYSVVTEVPANPQSAGLYERSFGGAYSLTTDVTAVENKTYYTKNESATWTDSEQKSALNKTRLNLRGGKIVGDAFGGALGDGSHAPSVYGDILVELNKETCTDGSTVTTKASTEAGCVVTRVFGCNNTNGTPKGNVLVHVYGTQNAAAEHMANQVADTDEAKKPKKKARYDVAAVYGGGNEAAYDPADPSTNKTQVIIDGCDLTSIDYVYGGGNAAPVPATDVTVNSCYEIHTLFGGGNGSGDGTPGADVGIIDKTAYDADAATPKTAGVYGPGTTLAKLIGGEIHTVYGGSNEKGNVRGGASVNVSKEGGDCTLNVGQIYGAGNNAEMDGGTDIVMGCMPAGVIEEIYAGARNADVAGDVKLTLTSGTFGRVFGGNKHGGKLKGSITVNIEETGDCDQPLIIGELYGGGNLADYSVYGYNETTGAALESGSKLYDDPKLNVRAFTSIGAVYGGGYRAKMVANPTVDINVVKGSHYNDDDRVAGTITNIPTEYKDGDGKIQTGTPVDLSYPAHAKGAIGAINNVFGGGNLAPIVGNATVNIGTETKSYFKTEPKHFRTDAETPLTPVAEGTYAGLYETTVEGAIIKGSMYGGGNEANITGNTQVNICAKYDDTASEFRRVAPGTAGVTIDHDVFGAGKGIASDVETALVSGNTTIVMMGGEVKQSVYGGGELSQVGGNTNITVNGGTIGTTGEGGETYGNIYGGGKGNAVNVRSGLIKGNTNITVKDIVATAGNAEYYGVSEGTVVATPAILHNIYGGGAHGSVGTYTYASEAADAAINSYTSGGTAAINILGGTIGTDGHNNGMVFGSSRGDIDAPGTIYDNVAWVYSTNVVIGGEGYNPQIKGSVYGSGENGHTYQNASVAIHSGIVGITETMPTDPEGQGGAKYPYRGNVYGGGCGTDKYYTSDPETHDGNGQEYNIKAGIVGGNTTVTIDGGHVVRDVYGAGSMGAVTGTTNVTIGGNAVIGAENSGGGYVYAAARGDLDNPDKATVGGTTLNISGGTIWESAFGGGQAGMVKGSVAVNVSGGVVKNDVYGGGALAHTNTDNWNATKAAYNYDVVFGLTVHKDAHDDQPAVTGDDVSSYYTKSGSTYTQASGEAQSGVMYYERRDVTGDWITPKPIDGTDYYTTTLNLTGGIIGNAYGGGLGQRNGINGATSDIAAMVYGDVLVTVNGTAFTSVDDYYSSYWYKNNSDVYVEKKLEKDASVPKTGRVFGCNNLKGSPKGDVKVVVRQTKRLDEGQQQVIPGHEINEYEIRGVYGGGNLSHYEPADGKGTSVEIHSCENTSIEKVYGGGNAADVPATDVKIYGCFDIHYVFGGGNGADVIYRNGRWEGNDGANVNGNASVALYGGTISDAFIGSDTKGTVYNATGDVSKPTTGDGECALKLTNYYGSSKRAEVYGDVSFKIDACSNSEIENVYAGSYDAQIHGSITMTVTSGILKNVFGGNDRLGSIGGDITINIEEADACKPIIIQNLYGGGFNAPYPGEGATKLKDGGDPLNHDDYTKAVTSGKITINLKSFTRIDNIYGGGKGYNATVAGATEININMAKGAWAGQVRPVIVDGYAGTTVPNVHSGTGYVAVTGLTVGESSVKDYYKLTFSDGTYTYTQITDPDEKAAANVTYYTTQTSDQVIDDIGSIGNIYGGGDQGAILGTTSVNIGTATTVSQLVYNSASDNYAQQTFNVLGANITGNVYGGGNQAEVTGNTQVNICAKYDEGEGKYKKVAVGTSGVVINGTDYPYGVFGGGNDGDVGGSSAVYLGSGRVNESVYGGGCRADVKGNASVTMLDGYVFDGVYGGGLHGSVGTVTSRTTVTGHGAGIKHGDTACLGGKPVDFADNTGKCTVIVSGGQIGPNEAAYDGMNGATINGKHVDIVDVGFVFGAGRGEVENPAVDLDADFQTYVKETEVTISGGLIMASVYGGGENGRVRGNTLVNIQGGQIGCGVIESGTPAAYDNDQFIDPTTAELSESDLNDAALAETSHWPFGVIKGGKTVFEPYDPYADDAPTRFPGGSTSAPSDGKTYYGSVFGGGSGYFPYVKATEGTGEDAKVTDYDWLHSAGIVEGNTVVNITGGHILTNVYGGNEYTDVLGSCTVTMSGGTIGVPRKATQIAAHPLSGLLFGAGKGDQRSRFYDITNVGSTSVTISGGIIYGSVFGGAEDGHVLGNTSVTISDDAKIGTWGTTGLDGNVFGGGRGYSGTTLGAGNIGGNAGITISGGKVLGSVYGGGRMASVGTDFSRAQDPLEGQFVGDGQAVLYKAGDYIPIGKAVGDERIPSGNHGHITIDISGGTIGNNRESAVIAAGGHTKGGNVYGGSMGRLTLLDGTPSGLWVKMAQTKTPTINISGTSTIIKSNVYGGGELGTTRDNATISISNGTIEGSVYGGGYGSDENLDDYRGYITAGVAPDTVMYIFNPLQYAGCLGGETTVNVSGGRVNGSVYGGGELASVGIIDYSVKEDAVGDITFGGKKYSYNTVKKHNSYDSSKKTFYDFGLSWPYEFQYVPTVKVSEGVYRAGGKTSVNITGSATIDNYVFGGGKGKVAFGDDVIGEGSSAQYYDDITKQRYTEAHVANVRETHVTIDGDDDGLSIRTVYGGGDDGHVNGDANVTINSGTIQRTVFGGGKGESPYTTYLWNPNSEGNNKATPELAHSWTAGKVYGNTSVTINGGEVGWFVYGGGNMASVGKGNYSGGSDDYSTGGYGEMPPSANQALWSNTDFTNSGNTTITIKGGTIGTGHDDDTGSDAYIDANGIPYGSVFGGSRGYVAKSIAKSPRYRYMPDFFLGYVNKAVVNIGGTTAEGAVGTAGPTIKGSVYGGGQDGHVRNATEVKIFKGSIIGQGEEHDPAGRSGHVFGAGSGIGTYTVDANKYLNNSSGSVTCTTLVEVNGGSVAGNIYGGGALASVGPYRPIGASSELHAPSGDHKSCSYTQVDIKGGTIGGSVFGGSRGPSESFLATAFPGGVYVYDPDAPAEANQYDLDLFSTDIWADVNISGGTIAGNVYGGGEGGRLKEDAKVILTGGVIGTASTGGDVFGGGKGSQNLPAIVGGNTTVELNPGKTGEDKGCVVRRIFGCNDVNGSPKGHASVHVYATQHRNQTDNPLIGNKYEKYGDVKKYTPAEYTTYKYEGKTLEDLATDVGMTSSEITAFKTAITDAADADKATKIDEWREAISEMKYDVLAVYGGGNLAPYVPTNINSEVASVVIDGCQLTSIKQVYGGGNAAFVPGTSVRVNEAYEIDEVFGGGNGKDSYQKKNDEGVLEWYQNPGANVGYKDFTHPVTSGESPGSKASPYYLAVDNDDAVDEDPDVAKTKRAAYKLGSGVATTNVLGGRIHVAYGGSNRRGNISNMVLSVYQESGTCELVVDDSYGAGKDASTDATPVMKMDCVGYMERIFGGSTNADVYNDIVLTITNGNYGQVFGGNDTDGAVYGSITVNIEEGGCLPIHIDELYAGGYKAPYSKYGYKKDANGNYERDAVSDKLIPLTSGNNPQNDPCINVISASYIGNIYGGGYQATVVGNPHVNVNMKPGRVEVVNKGTTESPVWKDNEGKESTENVTTTTYSADVVYDEKTYHVSDDGLRVNVDRLEMTSDLETALTTQLDGTSENVNDYKKSEDAKTYVYRDITGTFHKVSTVLVRDRYWAALPLGYIHDNVYGGGNKADIIGNTYLEIGTGTHHDMSHPEEAPIAWDPVRNAADIRGAIFGGGDEGNVTGNTYVTFANGTVQNAIYGGGDEGNVGTMTAVPAADPGNYTWADDTGMSNVTITGGTVGPETPDDDLPGNVFGGGKGDKSSFYCDKGMVYATNVSIENGTVKGSVYGGGEIGRVEQNTAVTIGLETGASTPKIGGDVFGAGKGLETHGYAALVRGNPTVTIQGDAEVGKSVYGGGEIASVGSYNVADAAYHAAHSDVPIGMPYELKDANSGKCTVIVRGNAEVGPDDMKMPDDMGYVFGAGKGIQPTAYDYESATDEHHPKRMNKSSEWEYFGTEPEYLTFIETQAMASATDVTIGGNAFVKGSVYGGSENGHVLNDTKVTITDDCQIGNGYVQMDENGNYLANPLAMNRPYTAAEWAAGNLIMGADDRDELKTLVGSNYQHSLPECASWEFKAPYAAYDKYDLDGSSKPKAATDGHTFYGNVFGGGSGYFPYRQDPDYETKDLETGKSKKDLGYSDGVWLRSAGAVYGNATVEITGGHILTNVYGGNEMTDVGKFDLDNNSAPTIPKGGGTSTVKMSGGTVGVPRTVEQIAAHPVTCYLFGAGKGDQRTNFNTWTNVNHTVVEVTDDARIYGSVFGGGEEGHVLGNASVTVKEGKTVGTGENAIKYPYIGTTGTSYVDGNIFGGGRGFSGEALTAGSVGGNVTVNISDGTMLGSIYGGGRLASVGTRFTAVTDPYYGQLQSDTETATHGHITVNISGGTIGNTRLVGTEAGAEHSGNVFGGSMGRLTLLDGSISPIWPKAAIAKTAKTNISGTAHITRSVYGGCELSMLRGDSYVTIGGVLGDDNTTITSTESDNPVIMRNVFGGGYGSEDYTTKTEITAGGFSSDKYTFTPMQLTGIVCGDTHVNIKRGVVKNNVYGGGELATVGLIDFTTALTKKHDKTNGFGLSWPYEMTFIPYDDSGTSTTVGGTTNVTITGGRIGTGETGEVGVDNGNIYGGSKGKAGATSDYEFCGNVKQTYVNIMYDSTPTSDDGSTQLILGSVFGGAEDGHVIEDTHVSMQGGLVTHSLFGGGRGQGTYTGTLKKLTDGTDTGEKQILSITSGKVYGNTYLEMTGGAVWHNVFGGGFMASVGKGNYAGGADDYATGGYGEKITGNLWTSTFNPAVAESESNKKDNAWYFLNSGKTYLTITGGTIGRLESTLWDGLPSGSVFGSSRGIAAPNISNMEKVSPEYCPEFFSGYVNETFMSIGGDYKCKNRFEKAGVVYVPGRTMSKRQAETLFTSEELTANWVSIPGDGPRIYGSVYGGGQDGHVRREAHMIVNKGEIGVAYTADNRTALGTTGMSLSEELDDPRWLLRGNLFGAGSGVNPYSFDLDGDGEITEGKVVAVDDVNCKETGEYSTSAGSVTHFTVVDVYGGTIHRNIYGGGSLGSVGPPPLSESYNITRKDSPTNYGTQSQCTVNIAGTVGTPDGYGGDATFKYNPVYGGEVYGASRGLSAESPLGSVVWTQVNVKNGANIKGNVYGGGDAGMVRKDTDVEIGAQ